MKLKGRKIFFDNLIDFHTQEKLFIKMPYGKSYRQIKIKHKKSKHIEQNGVIAALNFKDRWQNEGTKTGI